MARPRGPLLVFRVLLALVEPLGFALALAAALSPGAVNTAAELALLGARLLVAVLAIVAGSSISQGRPHGIGFAKIALASAAASAVVRMAWFPGNVPPGLRLPLALGVVAYNAAWFAYLLLSPQAKRMAGEGA